MKMKFPDPDDILNFELTIEPDEGTILPSLPHTNNQSNAPQVSTKAAPSTSPSKSSPASLTKPPKSNARKRSTTPTSISRATSVSTFCARTGSPFSASTP